MGADTAPRRPWPAAAGLLLAIFAVSGAQAQQTATCQGRSALSDGQWTFNLRVDNDLFGGDRQDQGYTSGLGITLVSPNVVDYQSDPCLPAMARGLNRYLSDLSPEGFEQQNMVFSLGQGLFTPHDIARADLIPDDRPYAGLLLASVGYNARRGDELRTSHLRVGIVGPSALGRQTQNLVHRIIGSERANGWANQLRDEPVVQLVHERMRRWAPAHDQGGWSWDAIGHWGGVVGNLASYVNAGVELRYGWRLPDDFGSTPMRPAGENTAPPRGPGSAAAGWAGHAFLSTDVRLMFNDITLDGNTFRNSHSVDMRHAGADLGYGLVLTHGPWKFAFARYHRTREFRGQKETPVFGSFTISRRF
ncbi:MAG: lipid A deacylase LpxR family protein [Xenophilus sp.]